MMARRTMKLPYIRTALNDNLSSLIFRSVLLP